MDALDYDARLTAYSRLLPGAWAGMAPVQALPLLHAALHDLRNGNELALRHAASQVLHFACHPRVISRLALCIFCTLIDSLGVHMKMPSRGCAVTACCPA